MLERRLHNRYSAANLSPNTHCSSMLITWFLVSRILCRKLFTSGILHLENCRLWTIVLEKLTSMLCSVYLFNSFKIESTPLPSLLCCAFTLSGKWGFECSSFWQTMACSLGTNDGGGLLALVSSMHSISEESTIKSPLPLQVKHWVSSLCSSIKVVIRVPTFFIALNSLIFPWFPPIFLGFHQDILVKKTNTFILFKCGLGETSLCKYCLTKCNFLRVPERKVLQS